ncbi:MAG: Ig-like domain-containing protein, partial [Anaerolineae bacterium]
EIAVNTAVPIRATLYNVGTQAESGVPVNCIVSGSSGQVYSQTVNSGAMAPLTWDILTFPNFTPPSSGSYDITCASQLPGDGNPANDAYTQTVTAVNEIADVWTKDNPNDNGDVPSDLHNWYESPDLWIRNNPDGGLIHQDPIAGITNTVYVRLRNRGTVAITGTVDVYWIEPSLGVRCGDWAYIDTIAFSSLLPGEVRIVNTEWVPSRTGHTCLQDVIDSASDPYNRGLECSPQWVPWDNNVEWHNVNILANPSNGRFLGTMDIKTADVQLANVYNLPQDVDLIINRRTFPTTGTITVQLPGDLFDRWQASANGFGQGINVITATQEIQITGAISGTIGGIPMNAAEAAQVGLVFDGPVGLTFEMAVEERIDDLTVGGVTYRWTIPDTTPPTVTDVSPGDTAVAVDPDAPIIITFDEPVSPLNFNLSMTPDPGGWRYTWSDDNRVVTATHNTLADETAYNLSVTTTDAASNSMTAPFTWSFTSGKSGFTVYLPVILKP